MMLDDDWKGEHLIRGRRATLGERRSNGMSAIVSTQMELRRRAGIAPISRDNHQAFIRSMEIDKQREGRAKKAK